MVFISGFLSPLTVTGGFLRENRGGKDSCEYLSYTSLSLSPLLFYLSIYYLGSKLKQFNEKE